MKEIVRHSHTYQVREITHTNIFSSLRFIKGSLRDLGYLKYEIQTDNRKYLNKQLKLYD